MNSVAVRGSVEEAYQTADAAWKRHEVLLQKMEQKLDREKSSCSSVRYAELLDEINHQKMVVEMAHGEMSQALAALEAHQYEAGREWQVQQQNQRRGELVQQVADKVSRMKKAEETIQALQNLIATVNWEKDVLLQELNRLPPQNGGTN